MSTVFVPLLSTLKHDCGKTLFFFYPPEFCVECRKTLSGVQSVVVPSPFANQNNFTCSVLLKPTTGSFLFDYSFGSNLHIGIVDSKGCITSFDQEGLRRDSFCVWSQSLIVLNSESFSTSSENWDEYFVETSTLEDVWSKNKYDENIWNCFDFILHFLKRLPITDSLTDIDVFESKSRFVETFVKPKLIRTTKFIEVYRRVLYRNGCVAV